MTSEFVTEVDKLVQGIVLKDGKEYFASMMVIDIAEARAFKMANNESTIYTHLLNHMDTCPTWIRASDRIKETSTFILMGRAWSVSSSHHTKADYMNLLFLKDFNSNIEEITEWAQGCLSDHIDVLVWKEYWINALEENSYPDNQ